MREIVGSFVQVPASQKWEDPEVLRKEKEFVADYNKYIAYYRSLDKPFMAMQWLYKHRRVFVTLSTFFFVLNMTGLFLTAAHGNKMSIWLIVSFGISLLLGSPLPKRIGEFLFWVRIGRHLTVVHRAKIA